MWIDSSRVRYMDCRHEEITGQAVKFVYTLQEFRGRGSSVPIVSRVVSGRWTKERGRF